MPRKLLGFSLQFKQSSLVMQLSNWKEIKRKEKYLKVNSLGTGKYKQVTDIFREKALLTFKQLALDDDTDFQIDVDSRVELKRTLSEQWQLSQACCMFFNT